ncbi:MAG: FAD-dependent oxidoreductase [Deltaproteobacteria bacterium]|nr:FAD-dependent oxidoreductase [Deltaproteobacteria bacterium]
MRLVIIGGDAAGMSAASAAKRMDPTAEVIVLEKSEDVSYGACGLPYKLAAGAMTDLEVMSAATFRDTRGIDLRLRHQVTGLDPASRTVTVQTPAGTTALSYDRLLLATGASVWAPPIEGLSELLGRGVYFLKTLEDGRRLRERLERHKPARVAVIGGGYIGLEATEGLQALGAQVTVIEALPLLLPFLSPPQRAAVMAEAEAHRVTVRTDTRVASIREQPDGSLQIATSSGTLQADLALVATGVRPSSELAREAGIALGAGGSVAVDGALRTSAEGVWAAGDCADAQHALTGRSTWVPLALRANRSGKLAASAMLGHQVAAPPILGTAAFQFFGLQIARTGLGLDEAVAAGFDAVAASVKTGTRAHYYPGGGPLFTSLVGERGTGRLLGAVMVGPEGAAHRIDTVVAAIRGGMTATELYELDLVYAPPFGPSWSPLLTAASALVKAARR